MASSIPALVIDDDLVVRSALGRLLRDAGYAPIEFPDAEQGWERLIADPSCVEVVLLDRNLPGMDGLEMVRRMKKEAALRYLPVIMISGSAREEDVVTGIEAGVYYYLTKPFNPEMLRSTVWAAVDDFRRLKRIQAETETRAAAMAKLRRAEFVLRTPEEAREVSIVLASAVPARPSLGFGLLELMVNAVEHGNLEIGYSLKSELGLKGGVRAEVLRRLELPEFRDRRVVVGYESDGERGVFTVSDEGPGFDWQNYLEMSPERAFDMHGRGIALSRAMSFDTLTYHGRGNVVSARVRLSGPPDEAEDDAAE